MKTGLLNTTFGAGMIALMLSPNIVSSQDKNPCDKHYNNMAIRYNQEDYAGAYSQWQKFIKCDGVESSNLYNSDTWDMALFIMESLAENATDGNRQRVFVDSAYKAYEFKIANYEPDSYTLSSYGLLLATYDGVKTRKKQYELLKQAIEIDGNETDVYSVDYYFNAAYNMFAKGDEGSDNAWLVDIYFKTSDLISAIIPNAEDPQEWNDVQSRMDQLIEPSLKCDQLLPMVAKIIESLPAECEEASPTIAKYIDLLDKKGCTDSPEFKTLAVKSYECDKSHGAAYNLGVMYLNEGDNGKALEYVKEAIKLVNGGSESGKYNMLAAQIYSKMGNASAAASHARNAVSYNVKAWRYVADVYKSNNTCGSTAIERASVYWLASDYMEKAGYGADYYKSSYPTQKELFEKSISIGSSYTVPCFGESTTVRAKDA